MKTMKYWAVISPVFDKGEVIGYTARIYREGSLLGPIYEATKSTRTRAIDGALAGAGFDAEIADWRISPSERHPAGGLTTCTLVSVKRIAEGRCAR